MSTSILLERMKKSLEATAVLKTELATIKSSCCNMRIFAFEGVDDKVVYSNWLSKIQLGFEYEPFLCKNKVALLRLWNSLKNDLSGLKEDVYFFTDRDFDDLLEYEGDDAIFMTEKYSIENYLVNEKTLNEILRIEFHCHGNVQLRNKVIEIFQDNYDQFLEVTSAINFRIYLARLCGITQIGEIEDRTDYLADIQINNVKPGAGRIDEMVRLVREPTLSEVAKHEPAFRMLDRRDRYRGKFALRFFCRWLNLLLAERKSQGSTIFAGLPLNDLSAKGVSSLDQLAPKSEVPESFKRFIAKIQDCRAQDLAVA